MPISAAEPLLEVTGLSSGYGKIGVLRGIDMTVGAGEVRNCAFDFSHASAAVPAGGEVGVNLIGAPGWKFAVGGAKQFLIR